MKERNKAEQSSSSQGPRTRGTGTGARPLLIGLCSALFRLQIETIL
jgi:hypothetical protein